MGVWFKREVRVEPNLRVRIDWRGHVIKSDPLDLVRDRNLSLHYFDIKTTSIVWG